MVTRDLHIAKPPLHGPDVLAVQQSLKRLGYSVGGLDSSYGSATADAVKAFQEAKGLEADGVVGANTRAALGLGAAAGATAQPAPGKANPSPFVKPGAAPAPAHVDPDLRALLVHYATWAALNQQHFVYTLGPQRNEMFNRKPTDVSAPIHADCSQFYSACCAWAGIPGPNDSDYTGSLLQKGKLVSEPQPGDCVVWGGGTGEHAAMYIGDGWTIGFGHSPGAPNRVRLADMTAWMTQHGHSGVRFLSFVP